MIVRDIIAAAYREGDIIPIGRTPTANELSEALPRLNNFISSLFGADLAGVQLLDWPVPIKRTASETPYYNDPASPFFVDRGKASWVVLPPQNSRLLLAEGANSVIYFPESPDDGARIVAVNCGVTTNVTLDGNGRRIGSALTETLLPSDAANWNGREYLYRADLGSWVTRNKNLGLDDESPLPSEFDDLLIIGLLIRIAPRHGVTVSDATQLVFKKQTMLLKHRYRQRQPTYPPEAIPHMSEQEYGWAWRIR